MREGGRFHAILLPGGVIPAELAYADLVRALGPEVDAHPKELELYAGSEPPTAWGLQTEIEGIRRFADEAGFERFHLVGYSGGGACALAFCAAHPDRLLSLALNEPAWAGNEDRSEEERAYWRRMDEIMSLPSEEMMAAFFASDEPAASQPPAPPPGPPSPWMASRPAGLKAMHAAFKSYRLDMERLHRFDRPVLFTVGGRSDPVEVRAEGRPDLLARVFPDFSMDTFEERHHFDPPHRGEPERYAESLRKLWDRAGVGS